MQDGNVHQDTEGGILGRDSERLWYLSVEGTKHEGTRQFQSFRPQKTWKIVWNHLMKEPP